MELAEQPVVEYFGWSAQSVQITEDCCTRTAFLINWPDVRCYACAVPVRHDEVRLVATAACLPEDPPNTAFAFAFCLEHRLDFTAALFLSRGPNGAIDKEYADWAIYEGLAERQQFRNMRERILDARHRDWKSVVLHWPDGTHLSMTDWDRWSMRAAQTAGQLSNAIYEPRRGRPPKSLTEGTVRLA